METYFIFQAWSTQLITDDCITAANTKYWEFTKNFTLVQPTDLQAILNFKVWFLKKKLNLWIIYFIFKNWDIADIQKDHMYLAYASWWVWG